jgi:hypothetical protein
MLIAFPSSVKIFLLKRRSNLMRLLSLSPIILVESGEDMKIYLILRKDKPIRKLQTSIHNHALYSNPDAREQVTLPDFPETGSLISRHRFHTFPYLFETDTPPVPHE